MAKTPTQLDLLPDTEMSGSCGVGCGNSAHNSADKFTRDLSMWMPGLQSADKEWNPERDTSVARTRDIVRNHGFASGTVRSQIDNTIGTGLMLSAKPDWRELGQDADWASEWTKQVEAKFWLWANDITNNCDVNRRLKFSAQQALAYRSMLMDGEILAVAQFLPNRTYATAIQLIDTDRLSNPNSMTDTARLRGGIELNRLGAPVAYHIRTAHPTDWMMLTEQIKWLRVPRETRFGRQNVIHCFDAERPGQTRGKPLLSPILSKLKMLDRYESVELQAALINTIFTLVVKSEYPHADVAQAMGVMYDDKGNPVSQLAQMMADKSSYYDSGNSIKVDGVKIPHLLPGEDLKGITAAHPHNQFPAFESAVLREIAAGTNSTYEQVSRDYSKTNYSSSRAAMLEAWRFVMSRRLMMAQQFCTPIYALWLEEAIDKGDVEIPPGAPNFIDAKTAYTKSLWYGPKRGQVDPLKESRADEIKYKMRSRTLEDLCADEGADWEAKLEQFAREKRKMDELGLTTEEVTAQLMEPETEQDIEDITTE